MPKTRVVHCKKEPYDVMIDRMTIFGNPYPLSRYTRQESLRKYKIYFYKRLKTDPEFKRRVLELDGLTLGCWCKPQDCHGDIIVEYLESCVGIDTSKPVNWKPL